MITIRTYHTFDVIRLTGVKISRSMFKSSCLSLQSERKVIRSNKYKECEFIKCTLQIYHAFLCSTQIFLHKMITYTVYYLPAPQILAFFILSFKVGSCSLSVSIASNSCLCLVLSFCRSSSWSQL